MNVERHLILGGNRFRRGLVLAARDSWERALACLTPEVPVGFAVRAHNALGSLFLELGRFENALDHFHRAEAFCDAESAGSELEHSRVLNNLALCHMRSGDIEAALPLALKAVESFPEQGQDRELEATINLVTGVCLMNHEELTDARQHLERARSIFVETRRRRGEAMCLNNLGIIALEQGLMAQAQRLLESALVILETVHDVELSAYARTELGRLYFKQGDVPQALHQGSAALRILWDNMGLMDRAEVARLCRLFGSIYALKGNRNAALGYLQRATTYFAQSQMWREWGLATKELDAVIRQRNMPRERVALEWHDQELLRYLTALLGLMDTLESLYPESFRILDLVTRYAAVLGSAAGLEGKRLSRLMSAARLRDIGFTKDADHGAVKSAEVCEHPIMSERILAMFGVSKDVLLTVRHHHESYDGSGYPEGLKGEAIPLESRTLMLVEAYVHAVESEAAAGPGFHDRAMESLKEGRGKLDPSLLAVFIRLHEFA